MGKTLRVLHVEDSERDTALLARHLARADYEVSSERVETRDEMRAALAAQDWDVILCDYSMPHFSAPDALRLLKESGLDIPFIIISGTVGEEVAVEAMRAGADDYLMKDSLARLAPAIERGVYEAHNRRAMREAEAALRESEDRYRDLVEHSHDLICTHDMEGRILSVNRTAARALGYEPEELLGRDLRDALVPKFRERFDDYIAEIQREGIARGLMVVGTRAGEERIWEYTNTLRTEGVAAPIVRGVAHDVTEQRRAEEAVRRSEAELRAIFEAMSDVVIVLDREGRYLKVAATSADLLYRPPASLVGHTLHEVFPAAQADFFLAHVRRALGEGRVHRVEYSLQIGGAEVWFDGSVSPVSGDSVIWVARDITERKQAEEKIRQSERQLAEAQRLAHIGSWNWDLQNNTLIWSDEHYRIFGLDPQEYNPTYESAVMEYVHPEDRDLVKSTVEHSIRTQEPFDFNYRAIRSDGNVRVVHSRGNVISDEQGNPVRMFGTAQDVTELKRAEEQLRHQLDFNTAITSSLGEGVYALDREGRVTFMNPAAESALGWTQAELLGQQMHEVIHSQHADGARRPASECPLLEVLKSGQTVKVENDVFTRKDGSLFPVSYTSSPIITAGLILGAVLAFRDISERQALEDQLRQAQKMEAIGQLAGGVAHDFNNLLTAINGYSDLTLRRLAEEDPLRRNVEEVRKAGERAAALTRQLLAFSRKQVLQPVALDLNALVSDMEKMLRRLIGEDVELRTALAPGLGSIKADPGQVEQVIMNLAVNARDAMPRGGKLTIETAEVRLGEDAASRLAAAAPGTYVLLSVADTGVGIDDETLEHIFEPFFTTKEQGKGTGLGLSTVYGIVKQSGGGVRVTSEVGRGSTFEVYFPRVGEGAQEYRRGTEPEGELRGTETILLAEDEEMVRRLTREVLEMYGYRVLVAAGGGAALLICERHEGPIHLLITDLVMPEMSGRELVARVASLRPEMKVLFMSGYTDASATGQGGFEEGSDFIQKPFTPAALARKVREVLDRAERMGTEPRA
jgi:two-component system, cell cycle sensor histidine kinase and response regulator CckA